MLGKRKWSFLLFERGSCLPGNREEVVIAGTRTWSWTWLNSSGLPAWRWLGFPCSLLDFSQGHSLHLPLSPSPPGIIVHVPEFWDMNDGFPIIVLYCQSSFTCAQRNRNMTGHRGRHVACISRIWIGSYRKDVRQIPV